MQTKTIRATLAAICVAAALPSYAETIAPNLVTSEALFWFDASALTETTGTELDSWADVRGGSHPGVTTYTTTKPQVIEIADGALAGKKAVSFGTVGTACDMKFASVQEIKTAFFVVDLDQNQYAFLLGGPKDGVGVAPRNYGFHRGTGGSYRYYNLNVEYWNDGKPVNDSSNTKIPTGYQLITWNWTSNSAQVLYMGSDREFSGRLGGKRLCEVVAFSRELDIAERSRVEGYLKEKWFGGTAGINGATEMLGKKGQVHFDASVASSFHYEVEGDETGTKVSKWDDLSGNNNYFYPYAAKSGNVNAIRYGTRGEVAGKPVFDSGAASSGIDLALTRITNTRSVIMVAEMERSGSVFWLGDSTNYRFHRGTSGQFAYDNGNVHIANNGKLWQNGQRIKTPKAEYAEPPGGLSVYTFVTSQNCEWNKLGQDRDQNGRNGGKRVAELITFSSELTEADCAGVYRLMKEKWSPSDAYVDSLVADAPVHVDASSADNFNYTGGTITGWKNSGTGADLAKPTTLYNNDTAKTCNPGSYGFTNGVPAFLMGPHGSYIDLYFSRISNARTVFWVMDIVRDKDAFFLGDGKNNVITSASTYHFHRGYQSNLVGCYGSSAASNAGWYTGPLYCDGSVVASMTSERPPRGTHVYDVASYQNLTASSISVDRYCNDRNGGRAISELLILTTPVSGLTRGMIRERIEAKWTRSCGWAGAGDAEWGAGKYRVFDADAAVPAEGAEADGVGFKASAALSGGTLTLGDGGIFASEGAAVTVSAPVAGKLGVYGPGTVTLAATPAAVDSISVGYGATLTLAAGTTAVSGGLSIQENGKLILDVSALAVREHASITFNSLSLPAGGSLYDYVSLVGGEGLGHVLTVTENGIHVNSPNVAAVAVWTAAQNTNLENPANWTCSNFNGEPVANVIPEVSTTSVTFNADCDLRALGRVAFANGVAFDLNGHAVKIAGLAAQGYPLASVTNSDANATAELRIDVANGLTITNATVVLGGKMNFVKDGAGTFVAAKAYQPYVGVNEVTNGVLEVAYAYRDSRHYLFGAKGNSFLVRTGTTFKMNGMYAQADAVYKFVLDGGRLLGCYEDVPDGNGQIHLIELTKDSTFEPTTNCGLVPGGSFSSTELDLGGHTLTVPIGTNGRIFYLFNTTVKNGMVNITSGGWLQTKSGKTVTATNADFRVGSAMKILGPISVRDYEQVYGSNYNDGTAAFNVHGTFKPAAGHDYFYGCTMQNGSTIDLSSRTGALPLVSSFTNGDKTLKFAAGTIHVKLGERNVTRNTCLISWSSKPSGIASTRFVSAEGERSRRFSARADGLYLSGGTMIIVR